MTDIEGPRLARPDEYDELMRLLDRYFAYERGGMAAHLPHCYDPDEMDNHAVITVDGDVVSHVGAIPQTLAIGEGEPIDCWGIAGVATDRRHRGEGYMSRLLEFWLDRMAAADVPLSDLGGNRQRYNHFGWERAGREYRYALDERSFDGTEGDGTVTTYDGCDDHLDRLQAIHGDEPHRVVRDRDRSRRLFGQRGVEVLLYEDGDDDAYIAVTRTSRDRDVVEFGGADTGIEALLDHLFAAYDINGLTAAVPPRHPLNRTFRAHSRSWTVANNRMLHVRDLRTVLDRFAPQLTARMRRQNLGTAGTVTLGIADDDDPVAIDYGPEGVTVRGATGSPDLELDRTEMTGLLFGTPDRASALKRERPAFDVLFPLEFFVWRSERV